MSVEEDIRKMVKAATKISGYEFGEITYIGECETVGESKPPKSLFYRPGAMWRSPIFHVTRYQSVSVSEINDYARDEAYEKEHLSRIQKLKSLPDYWAWSTDFSKRRKWNAEWDKLRAFVTSQMEEEGWVPNEPLVSRSIEVYEHVSGWCNSNASDKRTTYIDILPEGCEVCQRCIDSLELIITRGVQQTSPDRHLHGKRTSVRINEAAVLADRV